MLLIRQSNNYGDRPKNRRRTRSQPTLPLNHHHHHNDHCEEDGQSQRKRKRLRRYCHLGSIIQSTNKQSIFQFHSVMMIAVGTVCLLSFFSNSNLVLVMGQNFGTSSGSEGVAVQLSSVDDYPLSVEALNKARIKAELDHEEQSRKHTQNVVRLAATDQLHSDIVTNRTKAYLSCESGEMIVKINFTEPFRGVGYSDYDRSSPCKFYGDGGRYYELRLPLKGCGTKQEAPRIFINNIILRFHRSLELEEDEIKTIICRYPPPLAPPPPLIAAPILEAPPPPVPFIPAKLSEVELLLIVSALLFLTLLLLGIGIGYYCLKRRNIKVVRKIPQTPTYVPEIKIPRVSVSSTETSEYSDERRSILSETSMLHREHYRYDNMGYVPEPKATHYDDYYLTNQDFIDHDVITTTQNVIAPPLPVISSQMVDDRYVTNASQTDLDENIDNRILVAPKKPKLTTIITDDYYITPKTTTEIVDEITTQRLIVPPEKPLTTRYIDDTFRSPQEDNEIEEETTTMRAYGPPVISKHTVDDFYIHPEYDTEVTEEMINQRRFGPRKPTTTQKTEDDYLRDVYDIDEMIDDTTVVKERGPTVGPTTRTMQTGEDDYITRSRDVEEYFDSTRHRPGLSKKPKLTIKNIDDFYVTNIVETETDEKIIKTGRSMPNLLLEVDYEGEDDDLRRSPTPQPYKPKPSGFDVKVRTIPREPKETTTTTTTITDTTITKLDAILRVIESPPLPKPAGPKPTTTTSTTTTTTTTTEEIFVKENLEKHFPPPTREKLRTVIITDEVFRTLIIESTTIEEYTERIERHPTYGPMFEPPTWEIIFRLLSLPEVVNAKPMQPSTETDRYPLDTFRSYRSGISGHEARSVTEEDVSFSRHRTFTASHFVPEPDYDRTDPLPSRTKPPQSTFSTRYLPDPRRYDSNHRDFTSIKPAFGGGVGPIRRHHSQSRPRNDPLDLHTPTSSSVFGPRRLANPYDPYVAASPSMRRRIMEYGQYRPYSPDIDALSLEPSTISGINVITSSSQNQSSQYQASRARTAYISANVRSNLNDEEIKSTTETDVYDWKRYS